MAQVTIPEIVLELLETHGEDLVVETRIRARHLGRSLEAGDKAVSQALHALIHQPCPTTMEILLYRFHKLIWRELTR